VNTLRESKFIRSHANGHKRYERTQSLFTRGYAPGFAMRTQSAIVFQSGSFCDSNCRPPE
jgi:hypothetical protein